MSDTPPADSPTSALTDLLQEQRQRWQQGECVPVEVLLQRLPGQPAHAEAVLDLIYQEFLLREERGEQPQPAEYLRRFPHLADQLQIQFAVDRALAPRSQGWSTPARSLAAQADSIPAGVAPAGGLPDVPGYELLGKLGRGGMGVVYLARHLALDRVVALKMILSGAHAGSDEVNRFRREAAAVARLRHPNVVQIYEIGEAEGLPFLALEYVAGGSLAQHLGGKPQPARAAAGLLATLARTMHAVHQEGLVHRDLKPGNVLLAACGLAGAAGGEPARPQAADVVPKITDFGLVKRLEGATAATQSGAIVGTPEYMAPEQAVGRLGDLTPRADVYSLGAILYEMLTGRAPFRGETYLDVLSQLLADEPLPPSRLQPKCPRDLETICLKCLEKEPRKRYATALALAEDLERFTTDRPILARPASRVERLWRWCRRNPALATAGTLTTVALLAVTALAVAFGFFQAAAAAHSRQQEQAKDAALRKAQRLNARLFLDEGLRLCEQGDVATGLFWLVRALDLAPDDPELDETLRRSLAGWGGDCNAVRPPLAHEAAVTAAALSPDGRLALTGSEDNTARLWDTSTSRPVGRPLRHPGKVLAVAFSPDGKTFATGCADQTARLWETDSGKLLGSVSHPGGCQHAVFSPDGKLLLTTGADGAARLWDSATRQPACPPLGHGFAVLAVAFSRDGKYLLTGGGNYTRKQGEGRVWEVSTGKRLAVLPHQDQVNAVALSPDGKTALTGSWDKTARLWDVPSGQARGEPLQHKSDVHAVAFSPDGKTFVTATPDNALTWNADSRRPVWNLSTSGINVMAFGPDSHRIALSGAGGSVRVWSADHGEPVGTRSGHTHLVTALAFSPDGRTLLSASRDGSARLWGIAPGKTLGPPFFRFDAPVWALAVSPDGKTLLTGTSKGAELRETATGKSIGPVLHPGQVVTAVAFHPDGRSVLTGSEDRTARLWRADTGEPLTAPLAHPAGVKVVAFTPDGGCFLTVHSPGQPLRENARLWQTATGQPLGPPLLLRQDEAATFSPDGQTLLAAGSARDEVQDRAGPRVGKWESATGQTLVARLLQVDGDHVAAFSPDGKLFLTATGDHRARVWDTATVKPLSHPVFPHGAPVAAAAFSPDGRLVLTGSFDRTARLWTAATGKAVSPSFRHYDLVFTAAIHPDGKTAWTGSERTVRRWRIPQPVPGDVRRLALWVQVLTCAEMDEDGVVRELDLDAWNERRRLLEELGGAPLP
jgi:WD40 repeat protein